jgi:chromosome segregation ATPase
MFTLGLLAGGALGAGAGYLYWGRQVRAFNERLAGLEASANQIQSERERLHHALDDILRERREMVETAEHLRTQVEQQVQQLESLARELVPPPAAPEADASP